MFSKGKSGSKLLENNPILQHYEVGRAHASGGPEGIWKIHEATSKADGKVNKRTLAKTQVEFSKWKGELLEINPMLQHYEVGRAYASGVQRESGRYTKPTVKRTER